MGKKGEVVVEGGEILMAGICGERSRLVIYRGIKCDAVQYR